MAHRHQLLERVIKDFLEAREQLTRTGLKMEDLNVIAATMVLAARVEAIEDALVSGLPTAGEGI